MKKSHNFPAISTFLLMSISGTALFAGSAFALDNFFLEIGKPASIDEINRDWKSLSEKYKKSLGNLTLYPKAVIDEQGNTSHVIQVGAINDKGKAQKICNMLFAKNIACFVIEGIEEKPPTMSVDIARAASSGSGFNLPWQAVSAAPGVAADNTEQADDEGEEETSEQLPDKTTAAVDVAEAIAVPLSDKAEASNVKIVRSEPKPLLAPAKRKPVNVDNVARFSFSSSESGRLNIGAFVSENEAGDFWKYVNEQHKDLTGGLDIIVQKTLAVGGGSKVQLSVGNFANGDAAADFCNKTIYGFSSRLKCSYSEEFVVGGGVDKEDSGNKIQPQQREITQASEDRVLANERGDSYERRRAAALGRISGGQSYRVAEPQKIDISDVEVTKKFWIQLAIADSSEEAQYRLKDIKKKNAKVIGSVEESISYSPSAVHGKYSAQIGSFTNEKAAQDVCDKLQQKGVDCLVVSK